jgi:hypothetical protein
VVIEGLVERKRHLPKRIQKAWKPKRIKCSLVLEMDVGLEDLCSLALYALVGRLAYRHFYFSSVTAWMETTWALVLGYSPTLLTMLRGWFDFVFHTPEDSNKILEGFWAFDGGILMLKRWRLKFDPATEYFSFRHLWVLLPGLPLHLWNLRALEAIGNVLGHYIKLDE